MDRANARERLAGRLRGFFSRFAQALASSAENALDVHFSAAC
jgi:hypothetical protein